MVVMYTSIDLKLQHT